MLYVIISLGLLFLATGFFINENNAKQYLSGYNMMDEEERRKIDIKAYLKFFRNFHIFLAISFLLAGTSLTYFIGKNAGGIFIAVYPIMAYMYFLDAGSKFFKGASTTLNKAGMVILSGSLIFVLTLLAFGFAENKLVIDADSITFKGIYGEKLTAQQIQSIELAEQLPEIKFKTNGFALGTIHKGNFRTKDGETIKLILNDTQRPVILITQTNGKKIYFSAKNQPNEKVLEEILDKIRL
jgi:hypothetical protein